HAGEAGKDADTERPFADDWLVGHLVGCLGDHLVLPGAAGAARQKRADLGRQLLEWSATYSANRRAQWPRPATSRARKSGSATTSSESPSASTSVMFSSEDRSIHHSSPPKAA